MRRWVYALCVIALVSGTAAACGETGRVLESNLTDEVYPKCTLVIRPDGVNENGEPKAVFRLENRRENDCRRCQVNDPWPKCLEDELPAGAPAAGPNTPEPANPPPAGGNPPPREDEAGNVRDAIQIVHITAASNKVTGFSIHVEVWGKNERPRSLGQAVFNSDDKAVWTYAAPCLASDYKIRATAEKPGNDKAVFTLSLSIACPPGQRIVATGGPGGNGTSVEWLIRQNVGR